MSAWKEACASPNASKVLIPKGTYLLNPITLEGPCKASIKIQVQGIIKAPIDISKFKEPSWVTFNRIDHFELYGGGVFDGQGAAVWGKHCHESKFCSSLPIVGGESMSYFILKKKKICLLINIFFLH